MFASGIPEKVVGEVTGHRSLKALCTYKRTSEDQQRAASLAISNVALVEGKEYIETVQSSKPKGPHGSQLPQISGNLSNCTFNFNFKVTVLP